MSHLTIVDYDSSSPPLRVLLAAAAPQHSFLDLKARSAIMLTVATSDECAYSQAVNSMLARRGGWDDREIAAIRSGAGPGDPQIDALLDVAREAAEDNGHVRDVTWRAALAAGWTEEQLGEAYASICVLRRLLPALRVHRAQPFRSATLLTSKGTRP